VTEQLLQTAILKEAHEGVQRQYGFEIGRRREELVTPALVLDIDAAQRNIERMADALGGMPATLRPHIKVHKSPELAKRQIAAGARGLSVATVWEAVVMTSAGIDDIFVVNTVAGDDKLRVLAALARDHRILVAVDEVRAATLVSDAAVAAGATLGAMIEVDTGMDRAGVDTEDQALELARHVAGLPGLRLEGVTGYEGHCSMTPERDLRHKRQQEAMAFLIGIAERMEREGMPCTIRSAGGTATWEWTATFPGITEIQAGTYVVMDNFHGRMVSGFEHPLTVVSTVISRPADRIILDAGVKSMGAPDFATIRGYPYQPFRFDEEHGIFAVPQGGSPLKVGDVVSMIPGYSPSTVNWYDAYHVVQDDVVVDIWPVVPRGPGHHGLAR